MSERSRCPWCRSEPIYVTYHDCEWGVPVTDDRKLFEFMVLDAAQAGLSWLTILKKREGYRRAFADFDPARIARFTPELIEKLLQNPGIVRNRLKVQSALNNAQAYLRLRDSGTTLAHFLWRFVDGQPIQNRFHTPAQVPPQTELSDRVSKELKARGFTFVGSTICYAFMQAAGLLNDHLTSCHRYAPIAEIGRTFQFPEHRSPRYCQ